MSPNATPSVDVSVILLTYNHEQYIEQALQSVLDQQGDFTFELIISDDVSPDRTGQIVEEFVTRHPDHVRSLPSTENIGQIKSFARAYRAATGRFVAYLDGDDYWEPTKLSRQLAFLEEHPSCPLCFHAAEAVGDGTVVGGSDVATPGSMIRFDADRLPFDALVFADPISASSVLIRRSALPDLPRWFEEVEIFDWPLWLLLAEHGDLRYIDEPLGAYRVHSGGVWSGASAVWRRDIEVRFLRMMRECFPDHRAAFSESLAQSLMRSARAKEAAGARRAAVTDVVRSLGSGARLNVAKLRDAVRVIVRTVLPQVSSVKRKLRL